jgi:hypothetical protein
MARQPRKSSVIMLELLMSAVEVNAKTLTAMVVSLHTMSSNATSPR